VFVILLAPPLILSQTELGFPSSSAGKYPKLLERIADIVRHHGYLNSMVVLLPEVCPTCQHSDCHCQDNARW